MLEQESNGNEESPRWRGLGRLRAALRQCLNSCSDEQDRSNEATTAALATVIFRSLREAPSEKCADHQLFNAITVLVGAAASGRPSARDERGVKRALRELPDRAQEALRLHVTDGLTYRQVAEVLKVPPKEALTLLSNAYLQLRKAIHQQRAEAIGIPRRRDESSGY